MMDDCLRIGDTYLKSNVISVDLFLLILVNVIMNKWCLSFNKIQIMCIMSVCTMLWISWRMISMNVVIFENITMGPITLNVVLKDPVPGILIIRNSPIANSEQRWTDFKVWKSKSFVERVCMVQTSTKYCDCTIRAPKWELVFCMLTHLPIPIQPKLPRKWWSGNTRTN